MREGVTPRQQAAEDEKARQTAESMRLAQLLPQKQKRRRAKRIAAAVVIAIGLPIVAAACDPTLSPWDTPPAGSNPTSERRNCTFWGCRF